MLLDLTFLINNLIIFQEEEDDVPTTVKTSFTVKLMKFDEKQKVALIKEVKNLLEGMNLVQVNYNDNIIFELDILPIIFNFIG